MRPLTLPQALEAQESSAASLTLLEASGYERTLSYRMLRARALQVLHFLQLQGVEAGDELVISVAGNQAMLEALWACLLGGIVAVPLPSCGNAEQRHRVLGVLGALESAFLFTERRTLEQLAAHATTLGTQSLVDGGRAILVDDITADARIGSEWHARPDDIALIQFSSGSTGEPKGVVLTHANVMGNIRGMCARSGVTAADSILSWMPLSHDMGLVGLHLLPLSIGASQTLIPTDLFARRPMLWLEKAGAMRATILASPDFGLRHCLRAMRRRAPAGIDLSRVRLIFNGAEPISSAVCAEFAATLAPHGLSARAMYPVYGLAEATLGVAFPQPGAALQVIHAERRHLGVGDAMRLRDQATPDTLALVGVGSGVDGCAIRITDAQDHAVAQGHVGHVQIKGDNVTRGYFGRSGLRRDGFCADGWFDTGDLGAWMGTLFLVGRAKDTIILNGQNFHPHDLERLCESDAKLESGKVACVGVRRTAQEAEALVVFVQHRGPPGGFSPVVSRVSSAIACAAGAEVHEVVPVESMPRTTSGKLRRAALRQGFENGEFDAAIDALHAIALADGTAQRRSLSVIERKLRSICASLLQGREIGIDDSLIDLGADSLALVEIQTAINAEYPDLLQIEDFLEHPSIGRLASLLERRGAQARRA